MRRLLVAIGTTWFLAACGAEGPRRSADDDDGSSATTEDDGGSSSHGNGSTGSGNGSTGSGESVGSGGGSDPNANADGDCMTDAEELALGTDPNKVDSDGDGTSDCDELDCVSNPSDGNETCYACGWKHNDPGNIQSNGSSLGSVMKDLVLTDQCGEQVSVHDFTGGYHILYMTAAW